MSHHVGGVRLRHLQVRHHRLRFDRLRRANPPHHVRGRVRQNAREVHAPARRRRAEVRRCRPRPRRRECGDSCRSRTDAGGGARARHRRRRQARARRFAARTECDRQDERAARGGYTHAGTIRAGNASQTIASDASAATPAVIHSVKPDCGGRSSRREDDRRSQRPAPMTVARADHPRNDADPEPLDRGKITRAGQCREAIDRHEVHGPDERTRKHAQGDDERGPVAIASSHPSRKAVHEGQSDAALHYRVVARAASYCRMWPDARDRDDPAPARASV